MRKYIYLFFTITLIGVFFNIRALAEQHTEVILASDVVWEALNPARGDNSPRAGTLWGDRKLDVPTGFLAKFSDSFSSPPIHNATYRAVVISGNIHNDDPDAAPMWMPPDSFWTQPKGKAHITAAKGTNNIALVEIDKGPYLVLPQEMHLIAGKGRLTWTPLISFGLIYQECLLLQTIRKSPICGVAWKKVSLMVLLSSCRRTLRE